MDITFGIVTGAENVEVMGRVAQMVMSIEQQRIPNYEIVVVCPPGRGTDLDNVRLIHFDEKINGKAWITKKKNLITEAAKYPYVVYAHDYMYHHAGWYQSWVEWLSWGRDFEIAVNGIFTMEGARHSDWVVCPYDLWAARPDLKDTWELLLPYDITHLSPIMYISGGWWIAKKEFMEQHPLPEELGWGESEDVVWSKRFRNDVTFKINPEAQVQLMKPGKWAPGMIKPEHVRQVLQAKEEGLIE